MMLKKRLDLEIPAYVHVVMGILGNGNCTSLQGSKNCITRNIARAACFENTMVVSYMRLARKYPARLRSKCLVVR